VLSFSVRSGNNAKQTISDREVDERKQKHLALAFCVLSTTFITPKKSFFWEENNNNNNNIVRPIQIKQITRTRTFHSYQTVFAISAVKNRESMNS
jgi:hypothetical protein